MRILGCLMVALCLGATAARADVFDDACAYFHARAASGAGNTVFRQHLSGQCGDALAAFRRAPAGSEAHARAGKALDAMQNYRAMLEEISLARLETRYPKEMLDDLPPLLRRPVTASGEVLIARVMGVITPREAWRRVAAN